MMRRRKAFYILIALLMPFLPSLLWASELSNEEKLIRQNIAQVISGNRAKQEKYLDQIASSGATSRVLYRLLVSWSSNEIVIYETARGEKIPIVLEKPDTTETSRAYLIATNQLLKDARGAPVLIDPTLATEVDVDMRLRSKIQRALDLLDLSNPHPAVRKSVAFKLGSTQQAKNMQALVARLAVEKNADVRKALKEAIAFIQLRETSHPDIQVSAATTLASLHCIGALDVLHHLSNDQTALPQVRHAAARAEISIRDYVSVINCFGTIFRGLSLGSILLVAALGLAITFGLMGIINMAHGEMIAIGAYATYIVENVFGNGLGLSPLGIQFTLPGMHLGGWAFQAYFIFAIPVAFFSAAGVGLVLEHLVIRFLYKRALESLLATWGVSLVLQQIFRLIFGANNVQVNSPSWLLGNFTVSDVVFGYNRVFIIAFAIAIIFGIWILFTKTSLGLLIRAVMQDREMASCMGVRSQLVNKLTFAFASGLAGLAGAFLSQIGNVGPNLGQNYIIDSFMIVVVGGVGSIFGTIFSALGFGISDQVLQQILGSPVLGKVIALIAIILFLQWKPGGLFPTRSRSLEG